jgi:hypothetical protein
MKPIPEMLFVDCLKGEKSASSVNNKTAISNELLDNKSAELTRPSNDAK